MKSLFQATTTTSIIAILLTVLSLAGLAYIIMVYGGDATTRTQIVTGLLALLGFPAQYYFGSSKNRLPQNGGTLNQADNITTITNPTSDVIDSKT